MQKLLDILDQTLALAGYDILDIGDDWIDVRSIETKKGFHVSLDNLDDII